MLFVKSGAVVHTMHEYLMEAKLFQYIALDSAHFRSAHFCSTHFRSAHFRSAQMQRRVDGDTVSIGMQPTL